MKTIEVLLKADMKRDYKCTVWFLRQHGKAMGGYGKPMRWHRDVVERYLADIATAQERKRKEADQLLEAQKQFINGLIRKTKDADSASTIGPGRMGSIMGRGGKGRKETAA